LTGGSGRAATAEASAIDGVMPAHGFLGDEAIAAILTYIRQSWGNDAPPIDEEEVAEVRAATSGREREWTRDELRMLAPPN
jgi:mono/diheme cytochrome c family protein